MPPKRSLTPSSREVKKTDVAHVITTTTTTTKRQVVVPPGGVSSQRIARAPAQSNSFSLALPAIAAVIIVILGVALYFSYGGNNIATDASPPSHKEPEDNKEEHEELSEFPKVVRPLTIVMEDSPPAAKEDLWALFLRLTDNCMWIKDDATVVAVPLDPLLAQSLRVRAPGAGGPAAALCLSLAANSNHDKSPAEKTTFAFYQTAGETLKELLEWYSKQGDSKQRTTTEIMTRKHEKALYEAKEENKRPVRSAEYWATPHDVYLIGKTLETVFSATVSRLQEIATSYSAESSADKPAPTLTLHTMYHATLLAGPLTDFHTLMSTNNTLIAEALLDSVEMLDILRQQPTSTVYAAATQADIPRALLDGAAALHRAMNLFPDVHPLWVRYFAEIVLYKQDHTPTTLTLLEQYIERRSPSVLVRSWLVALRYRCSRQGTRGLLRDQELPEDLRDMETDNMYMEKQLQPRPLLTPFLRRRMTYEGNPVV